MTTLQATDFYAPCSPVRQSLLSTLSWLSLQQEKSLYTNGMDVEQIWAQLGGMNEQFVEELEAMMENEEVDEVDDENVDDEDDEEDDEDEEKFDEEEFDEEQFHSEESEVLVSENESENDSNLNSQEENNEVNDDLQFNSNTNSQSLEPKEDLFFKMDQFEDMVDEADEWNSAEDHDEDIDYFDNLSTDEDDGKEAKYSDFFDPIAKPQNKKNSDKLELFPDQQKQTKLSRKDQFISAQIEALEQENIQPKPWHLTGESEAKQRPKDALLEMSELQFERLTKAAPQVTTEVTEQLDQMIQRRIAEKLFDNVVRKVVEDKKQKRPLTEVSDEKSQRSLAEIYAAEQQGQTEPSKQQQQTEEIYQKLTGLFQSLCQDLDSLVQFNTAPVQRIEPEIIKLETATPALEKESALPLTLSRANQLSLKEMFAPPKKPLKSEKELDQREKEKKRKEARKVYGEKQEKLKSKIKAPKVVKEKKLNSSALVADTLKSDLKKEKNKK